jgi:hypothetical protein
MVLWPTRALSSDTFSGVRPARPAGRPPSIEPRYTPQAPTSDPESSLARPKSYQRRGPWPRYCCRGLSSSTRSMVSSSCVVSATVSRSRRSTGVVRRPARPANRVADCVRTRASRSAGVSCRPPGSPGRGWFSCSGSRARFFCGAVVDDAHGWFLFLGCVVGGFAGGDGLCVGQAEVGASAAGGGDPLFAGVVDGAGDDVQGVGLLPAGEPDIGGGGAGAVGEQFVAVLAGVALHAVRGVDVGQVQVLAGRLLDLGAGRP